MATSDLVLKACYDASDGSKYVVLTLNKPPVNTLNEPLWAALLDRLDQCEQDPLIRGLIITSNLDKDVFTAGTPID